jgi:preprotein translocase subunit YajC
VNPAQLLPFVLILGAFYLLILRPARARQRQQLQLQAQVEPGVTVMTTSGIYGIVDAIEDDSVMLEIAPDTIVRITKAAIGRVVPEPVEDESDLDDDDDYDDDLEDFEDDLGDDKAGDGSVTEDSRVEPSEAGTHDSADSHDARRPGDPEGRPAG